MRTLILTILVIFACGAAPSYSFDLPGNDYWYYTSDDYNFWIPDKAQHYWGSLGLNELGKHLPLPAKRITAPVLSFSIGYFYEVWQEQNGIGFSERDLIADALGIISSHFTTEKVKMWMDYSTKEKIIKFNVKIFI